MNDNFIKQLNICMKYVAPMEVNDCSSPYEILSQVIEKCNEIGVKTNELNTAFFELKKYVEDYFDNLDLQQEVDRVLASLVESGYFTDYIDSLFQPFQQEVDIEITAQDNKINLLNNRVNELLVEGSPTDGNAELIDIRTDYKGSTYSTAGNAVRGQFEKSLKMDYTANVTKTILEEKYNGNIKYVPLGSVLFLLDIDEEQGAPYGRFSGTLISVSKATTSYGGAVQLAIDNQNILHQRISLDTSVEPNFGEWVTVAYDTNNSLLKSSGIPSLSNQIIVDTYGTLDNIKLNNVFTVLSASKYVNAPYDKASGTILTLSKQTDSFGGRVQLFFDDNNILFTRISWGSGDVPLFSEWKQVTKDINYENRNQYYKGFKTVTICGDSLSNGSNVIGNSETGEAWLNDPNFSWGAYMCESYQANYTVLATGGFTSHAWREEYLDDLALQKSESYMIWLGTNDGNTSVAIGSTDDINPSNPDSNPDTFFGNMGCIIQHILDNTPKAKIFLVNIPRIDSQFVPINEAIDELANHYNLHVVDLFSRLDFFYNPNSPLYKTKYRYHFSPAGYAMIANMIAEMVSDIMYNNNEEFQYINFINTEYEYLIP